MSLSRKKKQQEQQQNQELNQKLILQISVTLIKKRGKADVYKGTTNVNPEMSAALLFAEVDQLHKRLTQGLEKHLIASGYKPGEAPQSFINSVTVGDVLKQTE